MASAKDVEGKENGAFIVIKTSPGVQCLHKKKKTYFGFSVQKIWELTIYGLTIFIFQPQNQF